MTIHIQRKPTCGFVLATMGQLWAKNTIEIQSLLDPDENDDPQDNIVENNGSQNSITENNDPQNIDPQNNENEIKDDQLTCILCYSQKVEIALSPCGHLICRSCFLKCSHRCHVCRTKPVTPLKLYFN